MTEIDSLRLCPGTPSKVSLLEVGADTCLVILGAGLIPSLNEAALVIRGAIVGAAVEATEMIVERLWPGTSKKAIFCCSFVGATLGPFGETFKTMPARRAAALVVRGAMSGTIVVEGTALARKTGFPLALSRLPLPAPTVEGFVAEEVAYPSDLLRCMLERMEEARDSGGNWAPAEEEGSLNSSGSSWVGKMGDDAKRDAI
jgi:hypothetical protein